MRRTLLRAVTTVVAAVGVILPTAAPPAQADAGTVIAVIKQIYSLYQQFAGGGGPTLAQAIQQITAAIQASRDAIISQINQVATANVRACAASAVINFADINALTPDNLQAFALQTTDCVTQAKSLIDVVTTDKVATDQLGLAMNTVGPLALMARSKAGLTTPALKTVLVSGENTLVTALLPACHREDASGGEPGVPHVYEWICIAYNGDEGDVLVRNGNNGSARTLSENNATRNTSRAVAQAVIPQLA